MARPKNINKKIEYSSEDQKPEVTMTQTEQLEDLQAEIDKTVMELENAKRELEEKKQELTNLPKKNEDAILNKEIATSIKDSALSENIKNQKAFDSVLVTGRFSNRRAPGQSVKLPYQKYADDPVKWWPFEDGKVYTIPRGFADQINGGTEKDPLYYTPRFVQKSGIMDPDAPSSSIHDVDTSNKKYSFTPVNF
jgi:hypothetical protein